MHPPSPEDPSSAKQKAVEPPPIDWNVRQTSSHSINVQPRTLRYAMVGPLTAVLIGISVVFALWTQLGDKDSVVLRFLISLYPRGGSEVPFPEIRDGQVWRLITPIFLHFGPMHLLFNMLWLKQLGTAIENLVSTRTLLLLALVSGVAGNIGEFFATGPAFGGMSGVVYALFGYVWMKAKFDPTSGFRLDKQTVLWMIGWFLLCAFGAIKHVANFAHGIGLLVGVIWGFISAKATSRRFAAVRIS